MEKFDKLIAIEVDVQNDFCPGGALAVNEGDQVVAPLNELADYTRSNHGLVVASLDWHPAGSKHFDTWPVHCVENTLGAQPRSDLDIKTGDIIVKKGFGDSDGYSAFEGLAANGRNLEELLYPTRGERLALLIGGLATDYCVKNTVLDALKFAEKVREAQAGKIAVFAIADAMRAVNLKRNDGKNAVKEMEAAGVRFVNLSDVLKGRVAQI